MDKKNPSTIQKSRYKFVIDILWTALPSALFRLRGLFVLPLLTRVLGATDYGLYVQIAVVSTLASAILTLRLETACVRFLAAEKDRTRFSESFFSGLAVVVLFGAIFVAGAFFLPSVFALAFWGDVRSVNIVFVASLSIALAGINVYLRSVFRITRAMRTLSIYKILQGILEVIAIALPVWLGHGVIGAVVGSVTVRSSFMMIYVINVVHHYGWPHRFAFGTIANYLKFSVPLLPDGVFHWLSNSSSRYFVVMFLGLAAAGIYSASIALTKPIALVSDSINFALFPTVSKLWGEKDEKETNAYLKYSLRMILAIGIPAAVGLAYISQILLTSLATTEFAIGGLLILIIAIGLIAQKVWQVYEYIFLIHNQTKKVLSNGGLGAVLNLSFCYLFIPIWGIYGAALANALSSIVQTAVFMFSGRNFSVVKLDYLFTAKALLASGIMYVVISQLPLENFAQVIMVCLAGGLVYAASLFALGGITNEESNFFKELLGSQLQSLRRLKI